MTSAPRWSSTSTGCTACRELVSALAASGTASGLEPTGDVPTASADAAPPSEDDPDSGGTAAPAR